MDLYSTLSLWLTNIRALAEIDDYCRQILKLNSTGQLSDEDATRLLEKAKHRRDNLKKARSDGLASPRSYYPERKLSGRSRTDAATGQREPERWRRKRRLGDMASLKPEFRDLFTEGERAVLYIIMSDWKRHGRCDRSVKEIGDRAGVGPTTVRNALRKATRAGIDLLQVTERRQYRAKNLTNVITVVHKGQRAWLQKFRPNLGLHFYPIAFKKAQSTGTYGKNNRNGRPSNNQKHGPTGGLQPFARREPASG